MDLQKLKIETLRSYDLVKLKSVTEEIRKELNSLNMDIFTERAKKSGSIRKLKKNLARSLTLVGEMNRNKK